MWYGQVSSATAMHADILARSWLTYQLTGSTLSVALVEVMRAIPMLTLGLFAGVVADRMEKRLLLMAIQGWNVVIFAVMATLVLSGSVQLWHVYAYSGLIGIGHTMNQPVRMSFIPQLVGPVHMLNALSLSSIAINSTRLVGPAIVGVLIAAAGGGVGPAYLVSLLMYSIALGSTLMIRNSGAPVDQVSRQGNGSMMGQLFEGFRFMASNRLVMALVLLAIGPLAIGHSYQTMLPAYVDDVLGAEAALLGILTSVGAVGGLSGGLWIASRGNIPHKGQLMLLTGVLYGVVILAFGVVTSLFAVVPLMIGLGASQTIFRAANNATILENAPAHMRGRIMSLTLMNNALGPLAGLTAGYVADREGVTSGMFLVGGACLGIVVLLTALYPKLRDI
jgi:MFS family permease